MGRTRLYFYFCPPCLDAGQGLGFRLRWTFQGAFRLGTRAWDGCGARLDAVMGHADMEPRRGSQGSSSGTTRGNALFEDQESPKQTDRSKPEARIKRQLGVFGVYQ